MRKLTPRYAIALFPFVAGRAGRFGRYVRSERAAFLTMLDQIYRATPAVAAVANSVDLGLPGRPELEVALRDLDQTWSGGPFSERARDALAPRASDIVELLALSDRLVSDVAGRSRDWVVTHGGRTKATSSGPVSATC